MKIIRVIQFVSIFLLLFSCTPKGVKETNQKKIYLSNEQVMYDLKEKSFKVDFSINNYTDKTISNFSYILNFKDSNGVPINTVETFFNGEIESGKAKRAYTLINDFTRKNYKTFDIEIKK
jgi:hypothetical protein